MKATERFHSELPNMPMLDLTYIDKRVAEAEAAPQGFGMLNSNS